MIDGGEVRLAYLGRLRRPIIERNNYVLHPPFLDGRLVHLWRLGVERNDTLKAGRSELVQVTGFPTWSRSDCESAGFNPVNVLHAVYFLCGGNVAFGHSSVMPRRLCRRPTARMTCEECGPRYRRGLHQLHALVSGHRDCTRAPCRTLPRSCRHGARRPREGAEVRAPAHP